MQPPRTMDREEAEAYVDAAAAGLALAVAPDHRDGVVDALRTLAAIAAEVDAQALRLEDEAALTFSPLGPGDAPLPNRRRR